MKEDILKKFVDENRDDFDDRSPDADILGKIQARLGLEQPMAVRRQPKRILLRYWWAAAAVIMLVVGISALWQQEPKADPPIAYTTDGATRPPTADTHQADLKPSVPATEMAARPKASGKMTAGAPLRRAIASPRLNTGIAAAIPPAPAAGNWQAALQNESSSVRLAGVLASGKSTTLSDSDLQALFQTMNNDENSNVRLAALEVLKKQEKQEKAMSLIVASVNKQDDPLVQMELLASLSPDAVARVEQQLLDITQNPLTIDAVRNEAYAVLLRSNTHF